MDFKEHLAIAWAQTLKYIVPVLLLTLVQLIVVAISFGIMAPVTTAGYMQSLLLALREGREPKIGDLFSEMHLFLPLFVFGVLAMIITGFGFLLLIVPGFFIGGFIVFATIYMLPLMTDKKMRLFEAIKKSWSLAITNPLTDQFVLIALYLIMISVGGSIPLALLFTQPLATFFALSVYQERLQQHSNPQPPPLPTQHNN